MLYFKFERLLNGRDSRKIGNNTWLYARTEWDNSSKTWSKKYIALQHFNTELVQAFQSGTTVVRPYYSVTSMRRLYEHVPRFWRQRGVAHYRDPSGVEHLVDHLLMLRADGSVESTDYTPPPPPPAWRNKRLAAATIRSVLAESFDAWVARPVLGCSCCRKWAQTQVTAPLHGADLWAALTARDARVTAKCLWHSAALDRDAQVAVARRVLRDVPLAKRPRVLKRVRAAFLRAATAHYAAALAA